MKTNFKLYSILLALLMLAAGCQEEEFGLGAPPTSEQVTFTATPDAANPNIINFTNTSPGFKAIWDLGNGATAEGNSVSGAYALEGSYTVKLTIFTDGGFASNTQTITIAQTNPLMLNREDYNFLTGGASNANGKTWVVDRELTGHLGVGPAGTNFPEYWQAPPNDKAGLGIYDDELVFNLNGFRYTYINNGDTFAQGGNAAGIGGTNGADQTVAYTPPANQNWSITETDGRKFLTLSNGGFAAFYTGSSTYQILTLTENELYLKGIDGNDPGLAWYVRLVPKGFTRPKVQKPLNSEALRATFDTPGNVTWKTDNLGFTPGYDNPSPVPINTSAKVAMYRKTEGVGAAFANLYTDFAYKMDLTKRHTIKLKVYMPSYNDYVTEQGESWAIKNLLKQVSVKLQNSEVAQPWANQVEIIQKVETLDKWVQLTFDFSAEDVINRKDLDRIVIQIGGEGHYNAGIFFIDDFILE